MAVLLLCEICRVDSGYRRSRRDHQPQRQHAVISHPGSILHRTDNNLHPAASAHQGKHQCTNTFRVGSQRGGTRKIRHAAARSEEPRDRQSAHCLQAYAGLSDRLRGRTEKHHSLEGGYGAGAEDSQRHTDADAAEDLSPIP